MKNTTVPSICSIFCYSNGKFYIGSAVDPSKRYAQHLSNLRNNEHRNRYLQNTWNKYGESVFIFKITEEVKSKKDLIEREQYWMDFYDSYNRDLGFNICPTAGSTLGLRHTDEARRNMSIRMKGNKYLLGYKPTIETRKRISDANSGENNYWFGKHHSEETRNKISNIKAQSWEVTEPNGVSQIIINLKAFCKENNLTYSKMNEVALGKYPHHKKWKCRKIKEGK